MKRLVFVFRVTLTLVAFVPGLHAETVLLHLGNAHGSAYLTEDSIDFAAAVEDGVMEVFFDQGHIIFNAGLDIGRPVDPPFSAERYAVRIAKSGGASYLLEVGLTQPDEENALPHTAVFIFTDLVSERVLTRGELNVAAISREDSTSTRDVCIFLGRKIADSALANW